MSWERKWLLWCPPRGQWTIIGGYTYARVEAQKYTYLEAVETCREVNSTSNHDNTPFITMVEDWTHGG